MLVIGKELWESDSIVKIHTTKWGSDSHLMTNCALEQLKELLIEASEKNKLAVMLIDCTLGDFPPFLQACKIAKFFFGIRQHIKEGLDYTIMYIKNDSHKTWVDRILSFYTPVRPVHILQKKKEIKELLSKRVVEN